MFVAQASLTGESLPAEKPLPLASRSTAIRWRRHLCFMGTTVGGTAQAMVIATVPIPGLVNGGSLVSRKASRMPFSKGISRVSMLLIRFAGDGSGGVAYQWLH